MGLFCEDIREETSGLHTIVGVMPDNIQSTNNFPFSLPKLGMYVRISVGVESKPLPVEIWIEAPNNEPHLVTQVDADFVKKAQAESAASGLANAGLITKIVAVNFPVLATGYLRLIVDIGGERVEASAIYVKPTNSAPTA